LKPVAWRFNKNPALRAGPACQAKLLVAQINSTHSCSKTRMGSNRFWHIVSVVKEQLASLSSRVASNELNEISRLAEKVNNGLYRIPYFHTNPQRAR